MSQNTEIDFASLEDFYNDDPRRRASRECLYGVMWRIDRLGTTAEVSYIRDTEEIYQRTHGLNEPITVLGYWPADPGQIFYQSLEETLKGWPEKCGTPDGLDWLKSKLHRKRNW